MSQSSRRSVNRTASATVSTEGGRRATSVRGPASALSSFLRERGIHAGRLNPYGRLPEDVLNPAGENNAVPDHTTTEAPAPPVEANSQADGAERDQVADEATVDPPVALSAQESSGNGGMLGLLAPTAGARTASKKRMNSEENLDEEHSGVAGSSSANVPLKKSSKTAKSAKKPTGRRKKQQSDSDSDVAGDSTRRSGHSKRLEKDSFVRFCVRCSRRFLPSLDTDDLCTACLNIPEPGKNGTRKLAELKRRRATLVDDLADGQVLSLKEMCVKFVADNIDCVEAFGDIPENVKRSISRILSKRRYINADTVNLFIGPTEYSVELFDCAHEIIISMSNCCPNITSLTLKGAFLVSDAAFASLFSGSFSQKLRQLVLENTAKFGSNGIEALAKNCGNLSTLSFSQCSGLSGVGVKSISALKNLESLELIGLGQVSDDELVDLLFLVGKRLTKLALDGFSEASDKVLLDGIGKYCGNLQHLSLKDNEQFSDEGFLAFLNTQEIQPTPLKSLNLHRIYNLTDASINSAVCHHGPSLKFLSLNGLDDLTDNSLRNVIKGCPNLCELDVSWVRNFDDTLFDILVEECKVLHTVKVYGCNRLSVFSLGKRHFNAEGHVLRIVGNEFD
ncbi:hypothetical protein HDU83_004921 [Entophlyctis luteolus]|nr:hypothetical protein HDU83_004921 [Entophlyctis luteolus]